MQPNAISFFIFFSIMSLTSAVAAGSVTKIAALADTTFGALCVVKALPALASLPVTSGHV